MINTEMLTYFIDKLYEVHSETLSNPDEFVLDDETLGRFVRLEETVTPSKCERLFFKLFDPNDFDEWCYETVINNMAIRLLQNHRLEDIKYGVENNHLAMAMILWAMAEWRIAHNPKLPTVVKRWDYDLADMLRIIITGKGAVSELQLASTIRFMFSRCYYHSDATSINDFGVFRYQVRDGSIQECCYITHIYPDHKPAEFRGLADFYIDAIAKSQSQPSTF
jgi:hypothetical protein